MVNLTDSSIFEDPTVVNANFAAINNNWNQDISDYSQ